MNQEDHAWQHFSEAGARVLAYAAEQKRLRELTEILEKNIEKREGDK